MEIEIREYAASDFAFVRRCYDQYLAEERGRVAVLGIPDDFPDTYLPRLVEKVRERDGAFLVAIDHGTPCGYVAALPKDREPWDATNGRGVMIMDLYVVPARRRHGVGRRLFEAIERRFAARGFDWVSLGSMAGNAPAHAFYAALGYRATYVFFGKPLAVGSSRGPPSGPDARRNGTAWRDPPTVTNGGPRPRRPTTGRRPTTRRRSASSND